MSSPTNKIDLLSMMEEFGFFDALEHKLPDNFTTIYEIARVILDKEHSISQRLAPIIWGSPTTEVHKPEQQHIPKIHTSDEYESNLISSYRDVVRIYPHQFLLPEQVFYQKLAERSLWLPKPKTPKNFRYQKESDSYAPDQRKQKVYILFDTSASMRAHWRIHLAKAICYVYLHENKKELGTVFLRTFDRDIGPLQSAIDLPTYEKLITNIMRIDAIGRGTALEKAIITAIDDIYSHSNMGEAEILVITDGAAHIDTTKIVEMLGENITIHCVKIGDVNLSSNESEISSLMYTSNSEEAVKLRSIHNKIKDLEHQLQNATSNTLKSKLQSEIQLLSRQGRIVGEKLLHHSEEMYGKEIQKITKVFIQIEDLNPNEIFCLPTERIEELNDLSKEYLELLQHDPSVRDIQNAALLYEHLRLLLHYNPVDTPQLDKLSKELEERLEEISATGMTGAEFSPEITPETQIKIQSILKGGSSFKKFSMAKILLYLYRRVKRKLRILKTSIYFTVRKKRRLKK